MNQSSYITITFIIALIAGLFMYLRSSTKRSFKMAEFKFKGFKVGKLNGFIIPVFVNLEIFNPSNFDVPVNRYKVKIYQVKGKETKLLSTSEETSTKLPANGSAVNKITFNLNIFQVLDTVISADSINWNRIADDVKSELLSKVKLKVYAEVNNQLIEREIKI